MSRSDSDDVRLVLLGGCKLSCRCHGQPVCLPLAAHRLLSYLALRDRDALRTAAAEALWPHQRRGRAAANLRSALWQARSLGHPDLIECAHGQIRLSRAVRVDLREVLDWSREIIGTPSSCRLANHGNTIAGLARELLPGWSDDWLLFERERWDQVRLHTLEVLARSLVAAEQYLAALEAALAAVAIEPLRESANRIVIEVHIAEGNLACAIKHYRRYRGLLQLELGVTPSPQMDELVRPLVTR